jgi:hypothetical protein
MKKSKRNSESKMLKEPECFAEFQDTCLSIGVNV